MRKTTKTVARAASTVALGTLVDIYAKVTSIYMRDRQKEHFDYIVVGAGPAGSVLASELSADWSAIGVPAAVQHAG